MQVVIDSSRRIDEIDEGIFRVFGNLADSLGITVRINSKSTDDIHSWVVVENPHPLTRAGISTRISLSHLSVKAGKVIALYLEEVKGRPEGPDPKSDLQLAYVLHHTTGCPVTYWASLGIDEAAKLLRESSREATLGYNELGTVVNGIHIGYPEKRRLRFFFRK